MRIYLLILISFLYALPLPSMAANSDILAIIVTPTHTAKNLSKSELALIFWRKKLYWPNGQRIHPVNFSVENSIRTQFSKRLLNSLPETQTDYWNGLYYHGVSPPHVVHSTEAALRFVAETAGAIAYVPACNLDERVKAIAWIDAEGDLASRPPNLECTE